MTKTLHTEWTDMLSEYIDGGLTPDERGAVEGHLADCEACAAVLADLRLVVAHARNLPESVPTRDLWPAISESIAAAGPAASAEDGVIALPTARRAPLRPSGVNLSLPQLAAASVALALASAAITWWMGPGLAPRASVAVPSAQEAPAVFADDPGAPAPELATELEQLEAVLDATRSRLEPATVRILEKNLAVIERAIEESRQALAVDPGNAFLLDHLQGAYREKADYLREAASIVEWIS